MSKTKAQRIQVNTEFTFPIMLPKQEDPDWSLEWSPQPSAVPVSSTDYVPHLGCTPHPSLLATAGRHHTGLQKQCKCLPGACLHET